MKKYILSIFLIVICYIGYGQFPITQNLGSPNTLVKNPNYGGFQGGLVPYTFLDTSAANTALTYLTAYNGALVYTTSDSALYFRCCGATKWQQILPSGGSSGLRAWLIGGQGGIFTSPVDPQYIGVTTSQGFGILTNNVARVTISSAGAWGLGAGLDYGTSGYVLTSQGNAAAPIWAAASGSGWSLTGNAGTTAGTNFVGTTDNVDLVLKTNNTEVSRWNGTGALGLGAATDYGTAGLYLESQGSGASPTWSTPPGITTLSAIGATPNVNGATISSNTLNLQPASSSFGGVVTTATQGFGGFKYFPGNIGLGTASASTGSTHLITGTLSSTGFVRINLANTNNGTGSGVGAIYTNDNSNYLQYYMGSSTNSYIPDGAYIHTNGTGGYRFVNSGAGSKVRWSTVNAVSIDNGAYLGWDANEFYHIAIPQAASTSGKTVLLYDTASGGYFSQISLDSIGGSGGSGANTALSNLAAVAVNTSLISDANNTDDLGSSSLMWRTAYMGTSVFSPLVVGGTGTTSDLNLKTTSGVGASGADMHFLVGNNGATEAMTILNNGAVGVNTTTPGVVNGTTFASAKFQVSNAAASTYVTINTDLAAGGTGILFNRSAASANLRLWSMDSQPDLTNTSSKLTFSSVTDAGSPTNMLTMDRNAIMGLRIPNVTTQYDNTTTTLGNVTGLTYNVTAAKRYKFEATLYTTSDVAGGIKVAIGGTATATSIIYEGITTDAGLSTQGRATALGTAVAGVTAVTAAYVTITGVIVVNASGTLTVMAAANAATGTTSVLVGSTFQITEIL